MTEPDREPPRAARRIARGFRFAFAGLRHLLATQPNARIHLTLAALAVGAGSGFGITRGEWIAVILCIALVFLAEGMNTALEMLADAVHPERHPLVGRAKDCAAAAVLVCALASATIGTMIFGPRLWELLKPWT